MILYPKSPWRRSWQIWAYSARYNYFQQLCAISLLALMPECYVLPHCHVCTPLAKMEHSDLSSFPGHSSDGTRRLSPFHIGWWPGSFSWKFHPKCPGQLPVANTNVCVSNFSMPSTVLAFLFANFQPDHYFFPEWGAYAHECCIFFDLPCMLVQKQTIKLTSSDPNWILRRERNPSWLNAAALLFCIYLYCLLYWSIFPIFPCAICEGSPDLWASPLSIKLWWRSSSPDSNCNSQSLLSAWCWVFVLLAGWFFGDNVQLGMRLGNQ